jgi:rod shape determining protein RodA
MSQARGLGSGGLRPGGLRPGGLRPGGLRPGGLRPGGLSPGGFPAGALSGRRRSWLPLALARRAVARQSPLRQLDWLLLAPVLALSLIGTLLVWSATEPSLVQAGANPRTYLMKQLLNVGLGLILMIAVSVLSHRQLRLYAPFAYGLSCLALLAVLTPLGSIVNGAHSWISLPAGFQIEPSEFAKITIIVMAAMILGELRHRDSGPGLRHGDSGPGLRHGDSGPGLRHGDSGPGLRHGDSGPGLRHGDSGPGLRATALAIGCAAVPILLVLLEPDLGVVILMLTLLAGLIALSGIRVRWLAALAAAAVLAVIAVLNLHLLKAYQLSRLTAFLHPAADPTGTGYSAAQAKIAIGSGGMFGQGLFHGQLIAGNFVPEQHTDFIFAVAGEELGFAGTVVIISLLAMVLLRALRIAARADDQFGMLVAAGIAIWFAVQSFINIGMTVGIMPVTGLPLPFVSYGGSAMFADMIAIGLLHSVHRHRSIFS